MSAVSEDFLLQVTGRFFDATGEERALLDALLAHYEERAPETVSVSFTRREASLVRVALLGLAGRVRDRSLARREVWSAGADEIDDICEKVASKAQALV